MTSGSFGSPFQDLRQLGEKNNQMRTLNGLLCVFALCGLGTLACGPSVDQGNPQVADAATDRATNSNPCPPGQMFCGGSCTNVRIDVENCGACGMACNEGQGQTCVRGACQGGGTNPPTPPVCAAGRGNCDGNDANGCETDTNTVSNCGRCGAVCAQGQICSTGRCTTPSPTTRCGDSICNGSEVCSTCSADCGACAPVCAPGTGNCDGNAANGCEVNTNLDPNNCGRCGNRCTGICMSGSCINPPTGPRCGDAACNGTEICSSCPSDCGACRPMCAPGTSNCDGNDANGCEVTLATDRSNCGMCGIRCTSTETCSAGRCVPTCGSATSCSGVCRDLQTDPANCGACGRICTGGASCSGGVCTAPSCGGAGLTYCGGTCVDTNRDDRNCGACGASCDTGAGWYCNGAGRCRTMATVYDTYMIRVMTASGDPARVITIAQTEDGTGTPTTSAACSVRDELTTGGTLTGHECQLSIRSGQPAAFNANFRFAGPRTGVRTDTTIDSCYQNLRYTSFDTYGSIWVYKLVGGGWVLVSHRQIDNGSSSVTAGQGCNHWDPSTPCPSRMVSGGPGVCSFR